MSAATSTPRALSQHPAVGIGGAIFGIIIIGFGANAILRPIDTLQFWAVTPHRTPIEQKIVEKLLVPLGARDICTGAALCAASYFGTRKTLGWMYICAAGVAFADGYACFSDGWGNGEATHLGFVPVLLIGGLISLGLMDG